MQANATLATSVGLVNQGSRIETVQIIKTGEASTAASSSIDPFNYTAVSAVADYGILKTQAWTSASISKYSSTIEDYFHALGSASAYFSDTLTVANKALSGQRGTIHALIDVRGALDADDNSPGYYSGYNASGRAFFQLTVGSYGSLELYQINASPFTDDTTPSDNNYNNGNHDYASINGQSATTAFGVQAFNIPFSFGESVPLFMNLYVWAASGALVPGLSASASADLGHSIYWGGITSITDADGNAVSFDLSSESGQNYRSSLAPTTVPTPPIVWLLASALFGFVPFTRRRLKEE